MAAVPSRPGDLCMPLRRHTMHGAAHRKSLCEKRPFQGARRDYNWRVAAGRLETRNLAKGCNVTNGKEVNAEKDLLISLIERATLHQTLHGMSEAAMKSTRLNECEAATFIGKSMSTLAHARSEQGALAEDKRDTASCGCIPHIPGQAVQYRLYDLLNYQVNQGAITGVGKSRSPETKAKTSATVNANAQKIASKAKGGNEAARNATHRGFSTFMQTATAADTWPFSIQKDGRPMDLYAAILDDKLTGEAERLNLREFSTRLADAASQAYADEEAKALESGTPLAADCSQEKRGTNRWRKPGGPV